MRDLCHVLKVINKTTKEDDKGYITFADSTTSSLPFISSSTDGISPGPLMMNASACVSPPSPSWYTQGLACGKDNGLDAERIRNTDLFFPIHGKNISFVCFFSTAWLPYNINFFLLGSKKNFFHCLQSWSRPSLSL